VRNIKLTLQYDGTNFCGFELQPGKRSIRAEIEKALFKLFKILPKIINASRTDAGVHALCQVVNFPLKHSIPTARIAPALNSCLPKEIRVVKAEVKTKDFHARYSPKTKEYEYLIYNGDPMPVHLRKSAWQVKPKLDLKAMRKAAKCLVGRHDFSSFCASGGDDKNFVRIIHSFVISHSSLVIWKGVKYRVIRVRVAGSGFLYKMVRNMVGTLVEVGLGKIKLTDVKKILHAKDRRLAGRTAPAQGLCLINVNY
jgi:tRNA pseudouridine38-40 synthase